MGKTLRQQLNENMKKQLDEYEKEMRSHYKDKNNDFYAEFQVRKKLETSEGVASVSEDVILEKMLSDHLELICIEYRKLFVIADTFLRLENRITNVSLEFDDFRDMIPSESMSIRDVQTFCLLVMPQEGHVISIENLVKFTKETAVPGIYQDCLKNQIKLDFAQTKKNIQGLSDKIKKQEALLEELSGDYPDEKNGLKIQKKQLDDMSSETQSIAAKFEFLRPSKAATEKDSGMAEGSNDHDNNGLSNS